MISTRLLSLTLAAAIVSSSTTASAALNVDFGEAGAPAGELQAGFSAFPLVNNFNPNPFIDYAGTGLDNGTAVRVTLTDTATNNAARRMVDRGTAGWTGGQNALLQDWVGIDARTTTTGNGTDLTVRLANLKPGFYTYRSYHTDISTSGNQSPQLDFFVNGSLTVDNFQVKGQNAGANSTAKPNFFDTTFLATGAGPVDLTYRLPVGSGLTVLNGFELNQAPLFKVDINSETITNAPSQGLFTAPGWASLDATAGNGSSLTLGNTTFTVAGADGSRNRINNANPDPLTRDFIFDDGAGQDVQLVVTGLPAGKWEASIWSWDDAVPTQLGPEIVGYIAGANPEVIVGSSFNPHPTDAMATFVFVSDGVSPYTFFVRENSSFDRSRFNALQLVAVADVPEPGAALLAFVGATALGLRRRRQA